MGVIDRSAADGILGGMPFSVISLMLHSFEADVRQYTRIMLKAAHAGDPIAYLRASQALTEVAIQFGAVELARLARTASGRPLPIPDLPIVLAGEDAIGEMKRAYRLMPLVPGIDATAQHITDPPSSPD